MTLPLDFDRLWSTIDRSAAIGTGRPGGLCRPTLSDADREMRDQFVHWCREAGCTITIDRVGNIFARRAGVDDARPPVVMGSHLDTTLNGGRYDGILGVLAGLEILRTLHDHDVRTDAPLEVVSWTNEEGTRFAPPMLGAGAFAGVYDVDWVHARTDDDGVRFGEALARIGYAGEAPVGGRALDAYFELHIEQGPELDAAGIDVGIVTRGYTVRGGIFEARGETAHTGPCPMDERRNTLVGASMLAVKVNDIGWAHHGTRGKSTVSRIVAWPNRPGILSDWAQITCDVRHEDRDTALGMWAEVQAAVPACARDARVEIALVDQWSFGDERFDEGCLDLLRQAARGLGVPAREMASQAGHDAYHLATVAPTALIFAPCLGGITHNHREEIDRTRAEASVRVLLGAVLARANRPLSER
ncbi:MAG: Zn-dependent hydrolase [Vicinamibacterales bacterium]|nr:Zn-dependent hydrolase [Vicinamibacterales bacterium]